MVTLAVRCHIVTVIVSLSRWSSALDSYQTLTYPQLTHIAQSGLLFLRHLGLLWLALLSSLETCLRSFHYHDLSRVKTFWFSSESDL
ncbi:hypothetical protein FB451DRAFT_427410 [Mycena latifolia]|nr:hypothetical protein FB451DRAFT_427410 [Mycena latifolia]